MSDNKSLNFSLVMNKTENKVCINIFVSFHSENSLLLLYITRIRVNQSNMKIEYKLLNETCFPVCPSNEYYHMTMT